MEYGHVEYQIKGNDDCSNMQPHNLSLHTPLTPEAGSKFKPFLKVQIKLFITSLDITEYSISDINVLGTDPFLLKFPLYNRIFT